MHHSRITITSSPWETAQWQMDLQERALNRWRAMTRMKGPIRDQEAYNAVVEFNKTHGLSMQDREADPKVLYLRQRRGVFRRKMPVTLAKHA